MPKKYYSVSSYAFCNNNPIIFVDPEGARSLPLSQSYNGWTLRVDSWYGPRIMDDENKFHHGLDFNYSCGGNNDKGSPILATHEGVATFFDNLSSDAGRHNVTESDEIGAMGGSDQGGRQS